MRWRGRRRAESGGEEFRALDHGVFGLGIEALSPADRPPTAFRTARFPLAAAVCCGMNRLMRAITPLPATPHRTGDEVSGDCYRLMADKIEADASLLQIPLENIARWLVRGHSSVARLEAWRSMLLEAQKSAAGMDKLLALLRDESWEARQWKDFFPSPGILNEEELERLSWTSSH